MPTIIVPQYLNGKQAAAFLGYSYSQFKLHVKNCRIPRRGPKGKKFDKDDLRAFMENPFVFTSPKTLPQKKFNTTFNRVQV